MRFALYGGRLAARNSLAKAGHRWQPAAMRWQSLFDDLEGLFEAAEAAELGAAEVAERTRREGRRCCGIVGPTAGGFRAPRSTVRCPVLVSCAAGSWTRGADWLLLDEAERA
jgi:hypothetical protein